MIKKIKNIYFDIANLVIFLVDKMYAEQLKAEGIVTDADIKRWEKEYMDTLNKHFDLAKKITKLSIMDWVDTPWTGFFEATDPKKVLFLHHTYIIIRCQEVFFNLLECRYLKC